MLWIHKTCIMPGGGLNVHESLIHSILTAPCSLANFSGGPEMLLYSPGYWHTYTFQTVCAQSSKSTIPWLLLDNVLIFRQILVFFVFFFFLEINEHTPWCDNLVIRVCFKPERKYCFDHLMTYSPESTSFLKEWRQTALFASQAHHWDILYLPSTWPLIFTQTMENTVKHGERSRGLGMHT